MLVCSLTATELPSNPLIASVSVSGTVAKLTLTTRAGQPYNPEVIRQDVRSLYATGRFSDIRVEATGGDRARAIVFHVVESARLRLRTVRVEPSGFPQPQIPPGTPIDAVRAQAIARELLTRLTEQGHVNAHVEPELLRVTGQDADVILHVRTSKPVRIEEIRLAGEAGLDRKGIERAFQSLKIKQVIPGIPGIWSGWRMHPPFSRAAVEADLARLRSLYLAHGYFDASVRLDRAAIANQKAVVSILLQPGPRYQVRRWEVSGAGIEGQVENIAGNFRAKNLCDCLFDMRREAEKTGIIDFSAKTAIRRAGEEVDLVTRVERGRAYRVGRIQIEGNKRFSDGLIRDNMLLDETDPLDSTLLRKSLDRLNRSSLFQPVDERNVSLQTDERTDIANVAIRLQERKAGSWFLSGPVGPMSIAGPLQFTLGSMLPSWGRGILELSSYYLSFSLMSYAEPLSWLVPTSRHKFLPVIALQRPFSPGEGWKSGFSIAPQLGWKNMALGYGATHVRERLQPWLAGNRHLTPVLPITVETPVGDSLLVCEPRAPGLKPLRTAAGVVLQFASSLPLL
jgi:outer membrane protein insertion porin family